MNRRRFLAISAAALVASPARAETVRWSGRALGAEAEITLRGPRTGAERALASARAALIRAEALFSLYDPASALSRLNHDGALAAPPPEFSAMLRLVHNVHVATEGRFDPSVQPLWRALATGGDADAARSLIGWSRVRIGDPIRLAPGQALTLNGVAQGYATDMVSAALAAEGFTETLVNIGEFRAGDGDWRIGVVDPTAGIVRVAHLARGAVATSSPFADLVGGEGHIIGPHGEALHWSTVAVEADSAALADALSTALCLGDAALAAHATRRLPGVRRVTLVDAEGNIRSVSARS